MSAGRICTLLLVTTIFDEIISAPIIKAPWGVIRGIDIQGRDGRKMSGYLGIPFALQPTGKLRWQKPQPHPGPEDGKVFEATTLLPACPQELPWMGVYNGTSEDCLTLNVFVPVGDDVTSGTPKPVMVWIHGGGFQVGDAASYRPTKLVADNDVIVVTIQYRLGVFGFLSTGDATAPGNYGLWDQRLAFVWVKDNIRAFGGDPDQVTIFGESAGGMSVGFHVISPASTGLFRRAITQSGSPYMQLCFPENYTSKIKELASALGCNTGTSSETILHCLRGKSVEELTHVDAILSLTVDSGFMFMPRVDGEFLMDSPARLMADIGHMASARVEEVDILSGFTNSEGALLLLLLKLNPVKDAYTERYFRHILSTWMRCADLGPASGVALKVLEFIYRGPDAFTNSSVSLDTLIQAYGDALFNAPCMMWIQTLAAQPHTSRRNPSVHLRSCLGEDVPEFTSQGEAYLSLSTNPSIQHHVMRERLSVWLQLLPEVKNAANQVKQHAVQDCVKDEL